MSLTCGLTVAEATQGKAQGKAHVLTDYSKVVVRQQGRHDRQNVSLC